MGSLDLKVPHQSPNWRLIENTPLIILVLVFRTMSLYFSRNVLHHDEYWQSQEVAHNDVFGYGAITWEWNDNFRIRSPVYHSFYSLGFYILKVLGLDNSKMLALTSEIIQVAWGALFDFMFIKCAMTITSIQKRNVWLIILYTSWCSLCYISRSFINTAEAALFLLAFYHWKDIDVPGRHCSKQEWKARLIITLDFCMRPTSTIIWAPLWIIKAFRTRNLIDFVTFCFRCMINILVMIVATILIDSIYYGKPTCSFFNFLKFNFLESGADVFGTHHPLWFFYFAIPILSFGWFPFVVLGIIAILKKKDFVSTEVQHLAIASLSEIIVLSLSAHKEARFLTKELPILLIVIGLGLTQSQRYFTKQRSILKTIIFLMIVANLSKAYYSGVWKSSGSVRAMNYIQENSDDLTGVGFLTPCYYSPVFSILHQDIPMITEKCFPRIQEMITHTNGDIHKDSPNHLQVTHDQIIGHPKASHLIIRSDQIKDKAIQQQLTTYGYQEKSRFFESLQLTIKPDLHDSILEMVIFQRS